MTKLKEALTRHIKKTAFQEQLLRAVVVSVDKPKRLCVVKLDNGTEIEDILIQPISGYDKGLVIFPKVGSKVLLEKIEAQDMALKIASYTEIDEIVFDLATVNSVVNKNGVHIESQGEDLKTVLNEWFDKDDDFMDQVKLFMDEVNKIVVIIGNPVNVGAVTALKTQITLLQTNKSSLKARLNKIIC